MGGIGKWVEDAPAPFFDILDKLVPSVPFKMDDLDSIKNKMKE